MLQKLQRRKMTGESDAQRVRQGKSLFCTLHIQVVCRYVVYIYKCHLPVAVVIVSFIIGSEFEKEKKNVCEVAVGECSKRWP